MVYERQMDDFEAKNVKNSIFFDIHEVIIQNDVILRFLNNSIGFLVDIRMG